MMNNISTIYTTVFGIPFMVLLNANETDVVGRSIVISHACYSSVRFEYTMMMQSFIC